ncbi:MAG: SCO family protein [Paracoccaceae bacterium]
MIRAATSAVFLSIAITAAHAGTPLPFDLGGPYELTDQFGQTRTQKDPEGQPQLVFFGYANCPGICSAAMPLMADVVDALADQNLKVRPVMITVDPERDTVAAMGEPLAEFHPDFIGLTGDEDALAVAYEAFSVDISIAFVDPEYGPIFTHGGLIHLLNGEGEVLTILPPVLDSDAVTEIVSGYLTPQS